MTKKKEPYRKKRTPKLKDINSPLKLSGYFEIQNFYFSQRMYAFAFVSQKPVTLAAQSKA